MRILIMILLILPIIGYSQIFTSEIHYDDAGSDENESIEVYFENPQPADMSQYSIVLYNGNGGAPYNTTTLNNFTVNSTPDGTYYSYNYTANGGSIQNGAPDGWALVGPSGVIEFLSYEGTINATSGPAAGTTSTDIGAAETSGTAAGTSIQNDGFGNWTAGQANSIGAENTGNLPVEISFLTAMIKSADVVIDWQTATEINNNRFDIQKSTDGKTFETIGSVKGEGNSTRAIDYTYTDKIPNSGVNYYRLKQIDFDGEFDYSKVVSANVKADNIVVAPSRTQNVFSVYINYDEQASFYVYNMAGQLIISKENVRGTQEINISDMIQGTYFVVIAANSQTQVEKVVKL